MRRVGFTLIEIILVVGLIGLLSIALLPRLGGGFSQGLDHAAEILAADLRYAAQRAAATGRLHRWTVDLDRQTFRIEEQIDREEPDQRPGTPTHAELLDLAPPLPTREHVPVDNRTGEWRRLDESTVRIDTVYIGEDEFAEGTAWIAFSGDGGPDPAEIRLSDAHEHQTLLSVLAFTGEVRIIQDVEP